MKKLLPIIFVILLAIAGIAEADAPYSLTVSIEDSVSSYTTDVIVVNGDQLAVNLSATTAVITVAGKDENGLTFLLDQSMDVHDGDQVLTVDSFTLAEGSTVILTESGMDSPTLTLSWTQLVLDPAYEALISDVTAVLNGEEVKNADEFSQLFRWLAGMDHDTMGFAVRDLDQDGIPELLLGENVPGSNGTVFYDLYTLVDGEVVHVFDGWDRSRYYLCANGGIANEGSNSASNSFTAYYYFADAELHLMESIIFDSTANPDEPWFISYISASEVTEGAQHIDETDANYTKALYIYETVELDPFE